MSKNSKRAQIENLRSDGGMKTLEKLAEITGYDEGGYSVENFFQDNPGAVEAVLEWTLNQNCHVPEEEPEDEDVEECECADRDCDGCESCDPDRHVINR